MKVYIVTGIYRGMEFSVYDVCFTKQDAEDAIMKHPIYLQGAPLFIVEAEEYRRQIETDQNIKGNN